MWTLQTSWWFQLESNQRHQDFQSCALPTELWNQMAVPTGIEPAIPRVTGECDNRYTTEPLVAGAGFEPTTFGLWARRATRLLYPAILLRWRRKRDSNPCAGFPTSRFSRPVPSTRLGYSSMFFPVNNEIIAKIFYRVNHISIFFSLLNTNISIFLKIFHKK